MPKFPEPPEGQALQSSTPEIVSFRPGTRLWRVYAAAGPHAVSWDEPRSYGPTDSRFDPHRPPPHDEPGRAVCYLGELAPLCLAERYQSHRRIERHAGSAHLVGFDTAAEMRLLDMRGLWPTRAGASQAISSGTRARSRRWAIALWELFGAEINGLAYRSSMHGADTAVALWGDNHRLMPQKPVLDMPLSHPALTVPLARAGRSLGYTIA